MTARFSMIRVWLCLAGAAVSLAGGRTAHAQLTAQQIADSVVAELSKVSDLQCTVDVDYSDASLNDMSGGVLKWKKSNGAMLVSFAFNAPYDGRIWCDGTNWNWESNQQHLVWMPAADGQDWVRENWGLDLLHPQ